MKQRVVQVQHQRQLAVAAQLRVLGPASVVCAAAPGQGGAATRRAAASRTGGSGAELKASRRAGCDARLGVTVRERLPTVHTEAVE